MCVCVYHDVIEVVATWTELHRLVVRRSLAHRNQVLHHYLLINKYKIESCQRQQTTDNNLVGIGITGGIVNIQKQTSERYILHVVIQDLQSRNNSAAQQQKPTNTNNCILVSIYTNLPSLFLFFFFFSSEALKRGVFLALNI